MFNLFKHPIPMGMMGKGRSTCLVQLSLVQLRLLVLTDWEEYNEGTVTNLKTFLDTVSYRLNDCEL